MNIKKTCPLCREIIDNNDKIVYVDNNKNESIENKEIKKIDKFSGLKLLIKNILLTKKKDSRILVFSEYENSFENINKFFNENGICYSRLCGTSEHIKNLITQYNEGYTQVLLLNAKYYGSGINLSSTSDIIFFHRMTNEIEKQVIGRGYRIGRTTNLDVHYLLHKNETEYEKSIPLLEIDTKDTIKESIKEPKPNSLDKKILINKNIIKI